MKAEIPLKYILYNALKLSKNERAVIATLEKQKMARNATDIARKAGIPRTTTIYILNKLLLWRIVKKVKTEKHTHWMYSKQLNFLSGMHDQTKEKLTLSLDNFERPSLCHQNSAN